jgi:sugar lactone lactonase YvrE
MRRRRVSLLLRHPIRSLRALALSIAVMLAIAPSIGAAQSDSTWRDHERALQAARKAEDTVAYRAQLDAVYRAIGATPRIASRYAALALDTHDSAGASRWLGAIAAMGAELDTALVSRYRALAGARALVSLRALSAIATSNAGSPQLSFRLPDADMIAEDIAYDAGSAHFLVSSVRHGGIYAASASTRATSIVNPGADSSWGMFALGMARDAIWTTTAALPLAAHYAPADSGKSALLEYDLRTGKLRGRYVAPDSGAHVLGDLVVGSNGAVYVSDGAGGGVYALAPGSDSLRVLVQPGVFFSPQTPALSSDGTTLFVPDYAIGIAAVSVATGKITWITHSDSLALTGIDGMYTLGRDLIVVQNGVEPNRILRLTLDAPMLRVVRATALARGQSARSLTHATIAGGWLYFITMSGWERVAEDGAMTAGKAADAPAIMRVRIAP